MLQGKSNNKDTPLSSLKLLNAEVIVNPIVSLAHLQVGPMVDLCSGPHIPSTSMIKAVDVTNMSRAFWRGDVTKEGLMRVYAITFPDNKLMTEYKTRIEEARKRDHRLLRLNQVG